MRKSRFSTVVFSSLMSALLSVSQNASASPVLELASSPSTAPALPNDIFFPQQWALANDGTQSISIDLDDLHTVAQKGTPGIDIGWLQAIDQLAGLATTPVTVAVIDSGVDAKHIDLQGRVLTSGWDFLNKSAVVTDDVGHGTHVSGIIAANSGNGAGIAGVAPASVSIQPLRILSKGFTSFAYNGEFISDYAADAIRYAVAHGASVINMSLGWPKVVNTDNVRAAVKEAVQQGVLIVAAAGNDHKDEPTYPCAFEGVLCVGSITNTGALASYSNSGGIVDVLAPGDGILSLFPMGVESSILRIQGYERMSGTSQAAPHIAGMAAALRSAYPSISLAELKARILLSAAPLPESAAALYGLAHLKRALNAPPQPVFLPDFKTIEEIPLQEETLSVQGSISIQNLWLAASHVQARLKINGKDAGQANAERLAGDTRLLLPWTYKFESLDDSSDLQLQLTVSADGVASRSFSMHLFAARALKNTESVRTIAIPEADGWIGNTNGHLFSRVSAVNSVPAETGLPRYYQVVGTGDAGSLLQIFDPNSPNAVTVVKVPSLQKTSQVIHMDFSGSGKRGWLITGLGKSQNQSFFQFYFLDADFKPLWGNNASSTWQVSLTSAQSQSIIRNYATPESWIRGKDGKLLPCFLTQGTLPDLDNFNRLDPRHYKTDTHLYYLLPQLAGATSTQLTTRALDDSAFHLQHADTHLRNAIPSGTPGHLQLLLGAGTDLAASTLLWDIRSLTDASISLATGWDALSTSGLPQQALTLDPAVTQPFFLTFFDSTRGILAWSNQQGKGIEQSAFSYDQPQDPVAGLIAAFDLPQLGHFLFLETRYHMVAYHGGTSASLPIERDSTFPGQQFSEMFTPVIVGSSAQPQAGIYIDSTLVRGNRVSIAVWNNQSARLEKPLRYSLSIPEGCVQMSPVRLSGAVESFALPLLCQREGRVELRLVRPN